MGPGGGHNSAIWHTHDRRSQFAEDANFKGHRRLYWVFGIRNLNGKALANYTLRDRRRALDASVMTVST